MAVAVGTLGQLGIDTASPVTKRFDFISSSLSLDEEFRDTNGLRGTLSHDISRVRQSLRRVSGTIELQPNAVELSLLLPWILGANGTGSPTVTYALADSLQTRYVAMDVNAGNQFTYSGVVVNRATFRAAQGEPLALSLDVIGVDETISGTFPTLSINTANGPWMLSDLALTVNGTTTQVPEFSLTIDNRVDGNRFLNSLTLTNTFKIDRQITVSIMPPYGDYTALYNTGAGGVAVVATLTNGGAVLTLTLGKVTFPRKSPTVRGRSEVMLPLEGTAYANGATKELVTTLNPGP